ncbi:apolipoprotein D-like [Bemisia tabaci]
MLPGAGEYSILDTDYEQYAILWSCSDLGFFHADLIWVMGRDKDLPAEVRHKIYTSLQELGFDPEILVLTNHKNCPPQF